LTDQVTTDRPGFICLWPGTPGECQNCGGWTGAEGGPFPGGARYCSEDCYADAQDRAARARAQTACCPGCGFDRQEHHPKCTAIPEGYCPGGGGPVCACGASWPPASLDATGSPAHRPLAPGGSRA